MESVDTSEYVGTDSPLYICSSALVFVVVSPKSCSFFSKPLSKFYLATS